MKYIDVKMGMRIESKGSKTVTRIIEYMWKWEWHIKSHWEWQWERNLEWDKNKIGNGNWNWSKNIGESGRDENERLR